MKLLDIRRDEWLPAAASFLYFFFILSSYYTVRPLRDALAVSGGVESMQYLFTATFVCMLAIVPLYGWLTSRLPRRKFLPIVYSFFVLNLLLLHWAFVAFPDSVWLPRVFFVWVSIFNLFVVPVFWSFMADLFAAGQARRLFGAIAAGGSIGAIAGPLLVSLLVDRVGTAGLPLLSAALLVAALVCQFWLLRWSRGRPVQATRPDPEEAMGGSIFAGFTLPFKYGYLAAFCGIMFLGTFSGSLLYFEQAQVVAERYEGTESMTGLFARLDLLANTLTIVIQLLFTAGIVRWLGLGLTLLLLPALALVGFGVIAVTPVLGVIAVIQALRRAVLFAINNPAVGMLFTVVGPQSRYKFKQFANTVVYRAGDSTGAWTFTGMMASGGGLSAISIVGMVAALLWAVLALSLGRRYQDMLDGKVVIP
ncbi:MAG: MFS transporter [Pseudomonadota bacterium]